MVAVNYWFFFERRTHANAFISFISNISAK